MFSKVTFLEKLLFTKHLAIMVKAGIPLTEAFAILISQTRSKAFKSILSAILGELENGQALKQSLAKYPQVFDQFYLSLIGIGEESGTLEENLDFLSEQLAKNYALRKKIQAALLYPGLVFLTALVMGSFIALFILPKLVNFFEAFEVELPLATRILLWLARLMRDDGFLIVFGLFAIGLISYSAIQLKFIKPKWHRLTLKFPLFGPLLASGQLAQFSRNLGILLKSGVPATQSLETTAQTLGNLAYQNELLRIEQEVEKGKELGRSLEEKPHLFPPLVAKMITVGEKTGKLEETLLYLGNFYEEEIDQVSQNLTTILEPVLLVAIGLVVGLVALAIITPIYELTGRIGR